MSASLSFNDDSNQLGEFNIDYLESDVVPFKEVKHKISKGQLYDYYPAMLIKIGLFRPPGPILGSLFLPMLILTLMQVLVYFSSGSQNEKLMNCSVLLLACLSSQ